MSDRRIRMGCLFANLAEHGWQGVGKEVRRAWATDVLNRHDNPVRTFSELTIDEINVLIGSLTTVDDDYVMCDAPCPDGWPCVLDSRHVDRGEDHAREDGLAWPVRL